MTDASPLVLVVDDDDAIREALERALRAEGFSVVTAAGGRAALESVARRVTRTDADGKVTVLTDKYLGKKYNNPNDLTIDSKGRIYFSDPRYGPRNGMEILDDKGQTIEGVYRIDPDNKVTRIIGRELDRPNGLLVSPDDKYLYVADNNNNSLKGSRKLWRFDLQADDTLFWLTDLGWMMGPWLICGGLIVGASIVIFEGTPDYPEPDRLWRLVEDHGVTVLGMAPTAIRSLMGKGTEWVRARDRSSLRILGSTGETWNPGPWRWYFEEVGEGRCPIINYSGGTELGGLVQGEDEAHPGLDPLEVLAAVVLLGGPRRGEVAVDRQRGARFGTVGVRLAVGTGRGPDGALRRRDRDVLVTLVGDRLQTMIGRIVDEEPRVHAVLGVGADAFLQGLGLRSLRRQLLAVRKDHGPDGGRDEQRGGGFEDEHVLAEQQRGERGDVAPVLRVGLRQPGGSAVDSELSDPHHQQGADAVVVTILAGGTDVWRHDIEIPKKYGVDINVGDTRGVSGIFRALRTIPVMLGIARDMERLCPDATMLNYTNPMAMLCRAMQRETGIKLTGLCHSVQGTAAMLARSIALPVIELLNT